MRAAILTPYGRIDFRSALAYVWDLGVPVLPLNDRGFLRGILACEREET